MGRDVDRLGRIGATTAIAAGETKCVLDGSPYLDEIDDVAAAVARSLTLSIGALPIVPPSGAGEAATVRARCTFGAGYAQDEVTFDVGRGVTVVLPSPSVRVFCTVNPDGEPGPDVKVSACVTSDPRPTSRVTLSTAKITLAGAGAHAEEVPSRAVSFSIVGMGAAVPAFGPILVEYLTSTGAAVQAQMVIAATPDPTVVYPLPGWVTAVKVTNQGGACSLRIVWQLEL